MFTMKYLLLSNQNVFLELNLAYFAVTNEIVDSRSIVDIGLLVKTTYGNICWSITGIIE